MDPYSGRVYADAEIKALPADVASRLVLVEGKPEDVERLSQAAATFTGITSAERSKRRAANKAARKARRHNR